MLLQDEPLDYQIEEEYLMLQVLGDTPLSVPSLFCPVTISSAFSLWRCRRCLQWHSLSSLPGERKLEFVLQFLIWRQCGGDPLDAENSSLGRIAESSASFCSTLSPRSSLSYYLPFPQFTVERYFELWVFNSFHPRSGRESNPLHVGSTCMLFIRISSSKRLGKMLLFKALGGSKHY